MPHKPRSTACFTIRWLRRWNFWKNPQHRCPPNVQAKNTAKKALVADARRLVRIVQASPVVGDVQRAELEITRRKKNQTETHVPVERPVIVITEQ